MIIDIHTHIFPDFIAQKAVQSLKDGIKNIKGTDFEPCGNATQSNLLQLMRNNNIDLSVIMPVVTSPSSTESINLFAESVSTNEKLISFAGFHPLCDNAVQYLSELKSRGFKGIKIHPEFQKLYIDSDKSVKIFKVAESLDLFVLIHSGEDIGLPPPVHCTPERLKNLLKEVSGKNIIAAHLGGWNMWDDVEKYLVGTNINFDTAFISKFISKEQSKRIILSHGTDKILFGSDYPWENPADTLAFLDSLGLSNEDMDKITHKNALKIFG